MNDPLFQSLCKKETLYNAWQKVKGKRTAGGIDRNTVEDYFLNVEQNISLLSESLITGKYKQQPYLEVFIPKNEHEKRRLGLLTINDKIVQTAVAFLLTPIFEKSFLGVSYGYRSRKGPVKAIRKVQHLITHDKLTWLASCDIDNFFDTIPHLALLNKLNGYLKSPGMVEILRMFITMGRVNKHFTWKDSLKGIPQGGIVSPLLANFYLYSLDKLMVDNQYGFVRYADDFIILCKSNIEATQALDKATSLINNQLNLQLNDGSEVKHVDKGFEFLGIVFSGNQLSLSERKYNRLKGKMQDASRTGDGFVTTKLLEVLRGINTFYAKLIPQETLCQLDDELMVILRNKLIDEKNTASKKQKLIIELQKVEFFARQHNFKRKEYIDSYLDMQSERHLVYKAKYGAINSKKVVGQRKHEYQKLESAGFDLLLTTPGCGWVNGKTR